MSTYRIETMNPQQLTLAAGWARAEGWEPGLKDMDCFYCADPQGFLVGSLDGEPIATISAISYGACFGFLGFYIVKPEYRGQGYGFKIWQAALEYLGDRCIGLDGVVAQQANYRRSGFELAHRSIRYQGSRLDQTPIHKNIVNVSEWPLDEVYSYDQRHFPSDRRRFLDCWLHQTGHHALGYCESNQLLGYGVIRPSHSGYRIGPLFSDRPDIAEALFLALMAQIPAGNTVFLDVPEVNTMAVDLATQYAMVPIFEVARMYKGTDPGLPLTHIYGITSFELG